jgi:hypothetical protein
VSKGVASRPASSSFITWCPMLREARRPARTSNCDVDRTTHTKRNSTSARACLFTSASHGRASTPSALCDRLGESFQWAGTRP